MKIKEKGRWHVAVLMSVYNGERYLDEQLKSIYIQSIGAENITIYIRDDGSSDLTYRIIQQWSEKIDICYEKGKNIGPAKSFWCLLQRSNIKADYYALADQDDVWYPDKLERGIQLLQEYEAERPALYYSNARLVDSTGKDIHLLELRDNQEITTAKILAGFPAIGCTMVFNDSAKKLVEESKVQVIEMHDKTLILLMYLLGKVIYDPSITMDYRQHDKNVVGRDKAKKNNPIRNLNRVYTRWFQNRDIAPSRQAEELLKQYGVSVSKSDRGTLEDFSTYKKSIRNKRRLLQNQEVAALPYEVRRSFKIRILLNLF